MIKITIQFARNQIINGKKKIQYHTAAGVVFDYKYEEVGVREVMKHVPEGEGWYIVGWCLKKEKE